MTPEMVGSILAGTANILVLLSWIWIHKLQSKITETKAAIIEIKNVVIEAKDAHIERLEGERAVNLLRDNQELSKAVNRNIADKRELQKRIESLEAENQKIPALVHDVRLQATFDALMEGFITLLDAEVACERKGVGLSGLSRRVEAFNGLKQDMNTMLKKVTVDRDVPAFARWDRLKEAASKSSQTHDP